MILVLLTIVSGQILERRGRPNIGSPRRAPEDDDFFMPEDDEEIAEPVCPIVLSKSFELIRAVNNYRLTHGLQAINISRSMMSTGCAHLRDIASKPALLKEPSCGIHSWSSCCYPADHSNPTCMHRKALQVTTALNWNPYNVASYELAYEWTGGEFNAIRAMDMFVGNPAHKEFLLQENSWTSFKWRSIGAAVGEHAAFIWFGTLADPNGDFPQFDADQHAMELPGCVCTSTPITWTPKDLISEPANVTSFVIEQGVEEPLEIELREANVPANSTNTTTSGKPEVVPSPDAGGISLEQFLKGLTQ